MRPGHSRTQPIPQCCVRQLQPPAMFTIALRDSMFEQVCSSGALFSCARRRKGTSSQQQQQQRGGEAEVLVIITSSNSSSDEVLASGSSNGRQPTTVPLHLVLHPSAPRRCALVQCITPCEKAIRVTRVCLKAVHYPVWHSNSCYVNRCYSCRTCADWRIMWRLLAASP